MEIKGRTEAEPARPFSAPGSARHYHRRGNLDDFKEGGLIFFTGESSRRVMGQHYFYHPGIIAADFSKSEKRVKSPKMIF